MGKMYKPGQFVPVNGALYRAKKRDPENYLSCSGCALNNPFSCPNVAFQNVEDKTPLNCNLDGYILVKP